MKNIIEESVKNEIIEKIKQLKPDQKPLWGEMSANEMLCHCSDGLKVALGSKYSEFVGNILSKTIIKFLTLAGIPMAKAKINTAKEMKASEKGTKPENFNNDRDALLKLIDAFYNINFKNKTLHPFFGKLNKRQWGRILYRHFNHHLNQFGIR